VVVVVVLAALVQMVLPLQRLQGLLAVAAWGLVLTFRAPWLHMPVVVAAEPELGLLGLLDRGVAALAVNLEHPALLGRPTLAGAEVLMPPLEVLEL
jgi:hypothetical protein